MNRRHFMKSAALLGATGALLETTPAQARGKYNLRYAPRLDFLARDWSIEQRLEYFSAKGFDGTEYNSLMKKMTLQEAENYRKLLDKHGIEQGILVVNRGGLGAELYSKEGQQSFLEDVEKAKQYHRILDNKSATVVTGPELDKIPRDKQVRNIIDLYKRAADILEGTTLTLVMEPLNLLVNHPGYLIAESGEAWEMMKAIDSPHVKILFDIYHQQITEGNLINNIRDYYDEIGYFQVGDNPGRQEPGTGEVNWKNVFKAIHDLGYTGLLGMEHGLSGGQNQAGLDKCFRAYAEADKFL